jgi:hypothetical protein
MISKSCREEAARSVSRIMLLVLEDRRQERHPEIVLGPGVKEALIRNGRVVGSCGRR